MATGAIVVIGGNVDALVAAHQLARAGHRVLVLDPLAEPAEPLPTVGWVPEAVVRELSLDQHGLRIDRPDPWISIPIEGGHRLELSQDMGRSVEAIGRVSPKDAARWPEFCKRMAAAARVLESIYAAPAPDPLSDDRAELWRMARTAIDTRRSGRRTVVDLLRLLPMPVADLLNDWFESDALKGALGAMAIMHQRQGPRASGTAFALLHHHVGANAGVFRPPRSNLSQVLARRSGIELRRGAAVAQIQVREGRVAGVVLANGEEMAAAIVVSAEHPRRTLLEHVDPKWIDPALIRAIRNIRARGVAARVTLTLAATIDPKHLVLAPSLDYVQRAHDDAKYGRASMHPWLAVSDVRLATDGSHRVEVHVQCAPYHLADGEWDDELREALAKFVVQRLLEHEPTIGTSLQSIRVDTPRELEVRHGWAEGQAYDAELALDQVLWMRPVPALARYRTPIEGLYLCGPAMHPGGGIAGAAGMNAAREILRSV